MVIYLQTQVPAQAIRKQAVLQATEVIIGITWKCYTAVLARNAPTVL